MQTRKPTLQPLRQLASWVLPQLSARGWLLLALPTWMFIAFVVSVGPELQKSVFSAIASEAPDIYTAAYKEQVKRFVPLEAWLLTAFHWEYLTIAAVVAGAALRATTLRRGLVAAWAASIAMWTLADLVTGLSSGQFEITTQAINLTGNFLGAALIAALLGLALIAYNIAAHSLHWGSLANAALAAVAMVSIGAATSTAAYYVLRFIYQPLPASFTVLVSPPAQGFYWPAKPERTDGSSPPRAFDFLPSGFSSGAATLQSSEGGFTAEWRRQRDAAPFDLAVRLVGDCAFHDIEKVKPGPLLLQESNVQHVTLSLDEGQSDFRLAAGAAREFAFQPTYGRFYWLNQEKGKTGENIEVTHFAIPDDKLRIASSEDFTFLVGMAFAGRRHHGSSHARRTLTLDVDGARHTYRFSSPRMRDRGARLICHPLTLPPATDTRGERHLTELHVGALVSIRHAPGASVYYGRSESALSIGGVLGSSTISGLSLDALNRSDLGKLKIISVQGGLSPLEVDGRDVPLKPYDTLLISGPIQPAYGRNGELRLEGKAEGLWRNASRLNRTKWERLPNEWRLASLGAILTALGVLITWAFGQLRVMQGEDPRSWVA